MSWPLVASFVVYQWYLKLLAHFPPAACCRYLVERATIRGMSSAVSGSASLGFIHLPLDIFPWVNEDIALKTWCLLEAKSLVQSLRLFWQQTPFETDICWSKWFDVILCSPAMLCFSYDVMRNNVQPDCFGLVIL